MTVPGTAFELRGRFAGFLRNAGGKRRLRLECAEGHLELKLPRELRELAMSRLVAGAEIALHGLDFAHHGHLRRTVLGLRVLDPAPAHFTCPLRVCTKKNCWKQGGRELWRAVEEEAASVDAPLILEGVGCLDRCKQAPNLDCGDLAFERCTPGQARRLVHDLAGP